MNFTNKQDAFKKQGELWNADQKNYTVVTVKNDDDSIRYELNEAKPNESFINAVLIDVGENALIPCRFSTSTYKNICKLIGADIIDAVRVDEESDACIYIDDEGLYKEDNKPFYIADRKLLGNAVLVGTMEDGNDADCPMTLDELNTLISFTSPNTPITKMLNYLENYCEEKGISTGHIFSYDIDGTTEIMPLSAVLQMAAEQIGSQEDIKKQIAMIEFKNADPLHFFEFLGKLFMGERIKEYLLFSEDNAATSNRGVRP